jgi:hypothetical protein
MKNNVLNLVLKAFVVLAFVSTSHAQGNGSDVYWHIDPSVKSCSMVIDPSLTQSQWHTFTKEVGAISSFKSLASARTLGRMNVHFALDYGSTPVDQHDPAWINTFTHPDGDCPLGDAVAYPTLRASMGVTDNMDVGGYWSAAPGANYGMLGGEFKYAFLEESETIPAAAVRASATILTGVPDFNLNIYSVDLLASKEIAKVTPYVGIRTSLAIGTETTPKVDLETETAPIVQGYVGVAYSIWMLNLAAEYNVSSVNTFAFAIGLNF